MNSVEMELELRKKTLCEIEEVKSRLTRTLSPTFQEPLFESTNKNLAITRHSHSSYILVGYSETL